MKFPECAPSILLALYGLCLIVVYPRISVVMILISLGVGLIVQSVCSSLMLTTAAAGLALIVMAYFAPKLDGFRGSSSEDVSGLLSKMKANESKKDYEVSGSGSGLVIEGYEDVKKEKNETQAPAEIKTELPMPFKLGEIPSQVKNGPHIDAGSTLMKAIKSLNPDQINAMTKDTQQLIETQKSLMGMLGTMKPMLNDGKELMDTFQQMFGQ